MDKLSIQGNCEKKNWYKILDVLDQLKIEGWFIQGRTKNEDEKTQTIEFNYTLRKNNRLT